MLFSPRKSVRRDNTCSWRHIVLVKCISVVILPFPPPSLLGLRPAWSLSWVGWRLSWTRRSRAWRENFPRRSSIEAGVRYWAPLLTLCVEAPPSSWTTTATTTLTPLPSVVDSPCLPCFDLVRCLSCGWQPRNDLPALHSDWSAL